MAQSEEEIAAKFHKRNPLLIHAENMLKDKHNRLLMRAVAELKIPPRELSAKNLGISKFGGTPHLVILDASLWEYNKEEPPPPPSGEIGGDSFNTFFLNLNKLASLIVLVIQQNKGLIMDIKSIDFVNLHAHSGVGSPFDGFGYPQDHMEYAFSNGSKALALTDHGNMNGFAYQVLHAKKMKEAGKDFKPIFGVEAYFIEDVVGLASKVRASKG